MMKLDIHEYFQNPRQLAPFGRRPYIIAEAGVNHEGKMELAKRLIGEAAEGGADAIKFQTYRADTIASKNSPAYWDLSQEPTTSQYALFQKYDRFWKNEFEQLKHCCDRAGITFLSTPFDVESTDFLNDLVPIFKISSSDITNKPFIEHICRFRKPVILSAGASDFSEIYEAKQWIDAFRVPLALLHCVLNYPTRDEDAHLAKIRGLQEAFPDTSIGYSDHTLPKDMHTLLVAALLGACILEKHFTHDKTLPGNDHYHAMDKADLRKFRENIDSTWMLLGSGELVALPGEDLARRHARRSLVAKRDIAAGSLITREGLTWKRPAHGISPKDIDIVVGKRVVKSIGEDTILTWDMIE
jgi:N-acetylneuraminate synthase